MESKPKIRVLDEQTINQIAAGEVIENSASVIKELVENAIDAGADSIHIETKAGGRQWIRVSDNGCGMERDDVFLCLERHATSKITASSDLHCLSTLGFRGEAVPSIASISKLTIQTAPASGKEGTCLIVEGGKILECRTFSRAQGTTFELRSLFFNVPARKKFQKSTASDTAEIHKILVKTALCYPEIAFSWKNDEKLQFELSSKEQLQSRIERLFGDVFLEGLIPFEGREGDYACSGFISYPAIHRPNRLGQYLFVNERPLVCRLISESVLEGYGTRLPERRHPVFILHLNIPKENVDVNVHPQKREARFAEEGKIRQWIAQSIHRALEQRHSNRSQQPLVQTTEGCFVGQKAVCFSEAIAQYEHTIVNEIPLPASPTMATIDVEPSLFAKKTFRFLSWLGSFAVLEAEDGLKILDLKAAHARVFYERTLAKNETLSLQTLLFPISIQLQKEEALLLEESLDLFPKVGIQGRLLSGFLFVIDAIPPEIECDQVSIIVERIISDLKSYKQSIKPEKMAMRLCEQIRKKKWTENEVIALYQQLLQCKCPDESPQGDRTYITMTEENIAKEFQKT